MTTQTTEIAPGVHRLALRGANVYFVRGGETWMLIDAGYAASASAIADAAERLCGAAGHPAGIVLTHGHPDHAGAAAGLAAAWQVPILAAAAELRYIDGTELYPEPLVVWLQRVLPRRAHEALARRSALGDAVRPFEPEAGVPGLPEWRAIPTPGHTPGHTAFFRPGDRVLIAGDAVLTLAWWSRLDGDGADWLRDLLLRRPRLSGPPALFTCDWDDAAASVASLVKLDPSVLATGHGTPLAGPAAASALRAFAARLTASATA